MAPHVIGFTKKHRQNGLSDTPTYVSWCRMHARCNATTGHHARYYADRGITVCERWSGADGYLNFLSDMRERPEGASLDRIDGSRGYSPDNCRWATHSEQMRNKSDNLHVVYRGQLMLMIEACKLAGINPDSPRVRASSKKITHQEAFDHIIAWKAETYDGPVHRAALAERSARRKRNS